MTDQLPHGFEPIETLERENHPVAFALRTGEIVEGWMMIGVPTPQARTYWSVGRYDPSIQRRRVTPVYPLGWRKLGPLGELPTRAAAGADLQPRAAAGSAQRSRSAPLEVSAPSGAR